MTDRPGAPFGAAPEPLALAERWIGWAGERHAMALEAQSNPAITAGAVSAARAHAERQNGWRPYDMAGSIAVIPVMGLLLPDFPWIGCPWATGCAQLRWQIREALGDDAVAGIALHVDSPGGYVGGVDQTASLIRAVRETKPVASIVAEHAFSAAYWIASAADTISAPRLGGVGHIGVLMAHFDFTAMLADEGIKVTLFRSGARKAEGHPLEPMTDAIAAGEVEAKEHSS
ncbi:MAG: S49 family peptidase, partial [Pseudomonadota bacterium]